VGTKNQPGDFACYTKALDDEPMFVLLARDPQAPGMIEDWAETRRDAINANRRPISDIPQVEHALALAAQMRMWRRDNFGRWRT